MQNVSAAVEPVSLPDHTCSNCNEKPKSFSALCEKCGSPLPLSEKENFFTVLNTSETFQQDLANLEKSFYDLSRRLHPDRFGKSTAEQKSLSSQRMSLLNQAYQTLKDPLKRREYQLNRLLVKAKILQENETAHSGIPLEISEMWFEIQDVLTESKDEGLRQADLFKRKLGSLKAELEETCLHLETLLDQNPKAQDSLLQLKAELRTLHYLRSLEKDIDRIVNTHSSS